MDLFEETDGWATKLTPILKKYKGKKHPLDYHNLFQLVIMVVLSAQDSDAHINSISPALFEHFPNMEKLAQANAEDLSPYISDVRNFTTKAKWLIEIAQTVKKDENIPL